MGGFVFYESDIGEIPTLEESLDDLSTNPRFIVLTPSFESLIYIMEHFPQIITKIDEDTILDRAESSGLSKAVLIIQVAWFCTNCASRLIQRLPLSLLEVSTAAHAFCTLLTYIVWWSKPTNVARPTIMRGTQAREVYALLRCSDAEYAAASTIVRKRAAGDSSGPTRGPTRRENTILAANALENLLPNPRKPPEVDSIRFLRPGTNIFPGTFVNRAVGGAYELIAGAASPVLYGAIHFLAWNDQFPTPLERLFWRVSSVVVTFSGVVGIPLSIVSLSLMNACIHEARFRHMVGFIILLAHVVSSGFLIVESFRQLFFLEPAAYELPSWTNYWPHLS